MAFQGRITAAVSVQGGSRQRVFFGPFLDVEIPDVLIQLHDQAVAAAGRVFYTVAVISSVARPADNNVSFSGGGARLLHDGAIQDGLPSVSFIVPAASDSRVVIASGRPLSSQTAWLGVKIYNESGNVVEGSVALIFPEREGGRVTSSGGSGGGASSGGSSRFGSVSGGSSTK